MLAVVLAGLNSRGGGGCVQVESCMADIWAFSAGSLKRNDQNYMMQKKKRRV